MKDIFLVRHGRQCSTRCNVDVSLDHIGRRQTALAAERLCWYGVEKLYTSGLKRAVETAGIIGEKIGHPPVVIEEFREIDFGILTGREDTEVRTEYADFQKERAEQTSDLRYPGGENGADVVARVMPQVEQICPGLLQLRPGSGAAGSGRDAWRRDPSAVRSFAANGFET